MTDAARPLQGIVVLDLSRMLPGAVLARMLRDLGARIIKIEDPAHGDPMRAAAPFVEGVGAGFAAFFAGAESVGLDLREPAGQAALRQLARQADVVVESFRPGTMDRWGLGHDRLAALNAGLVTCSLPGYGEGPDAHRVAHDMNVVAQSGLLAMFPGTGFPGVQLVDVTTGMLACSAIVAALLGRQRSHRGAHLVQPMANAALPFLTWAWADAAADPAPGLLGTVLAGQAPCYRTYIAGDGRALVLAAIEPKFWAALVECLGLPELAGEGHGVGEAGERVATLVAAAVATRPAAHWLALAARNNLPLTPVNDLAGGRTDPVYAAMGANPGYWPAWPTVPGAVPAVGQDTARILRGG